jgi:murein DD-endopeptidase MepM/ murein hydrolase activator NlpD
MSRITRRRRRIVAVGLMLLWLMATAVPARSVTEDDVEQARLEQEAAAAERAAALGDLEAAVVAYEAINAEFQELTFRMGQLRGRIDAYEAEVGELRVSVRTRAVDAYMRGERADEVSLIFASDRAQQAVVAREILAGAIESDAAALASMLAITDEMGRLREQVAADSDRVAELRLEAEAVAARMNELFAVADQGLAEASDELQQVESDLAEQRRLEEEERRRLEEERRIQEALARAAAGPAGGIELELTPGFICPVGGLSSFVDSWGAPRSGGRTHRGTDMMASRGTPLIAVADGVIRYGSSILGGNTVWLHADYGVSYFYAHLDTFAANLQTGDRVAIGTVVGTVGDTGNPAPGAYHLHFGIFPGGTVAVNPYPSVLAVCN